MNDTLQTTIFPHYKLLMNESKIHYQLPADELISQTIARREGVLSSSGALAVNTGKFTGRSPKDRFIVYDKLTADTVDWNDINQPIESKYFEQLYKKVVQYLQEGEVWIRDGYACADPRYRLNLRVITETPWANLFCHNMFLRPSFLQLDHCDPKWTVLVAPGFYANPVVDGVRQENFAIINFIRKIILIGGTAYTGEIKKGVFSVLNYLLLLEENVLSMHCSANVGKEADTALFFGLSGTGKTTLSADPLRRLIGDDEHGWTDDGIFNFEGGCYAKCIGLEKEKEPQIFEAIRNGALLENVSFFESTNNVNYQDKSVTENTRVSYPIDYMENIMTPSIGDVPQNIFFLTCDAYGVLPPISRLTSDQAVNQFLLGYTAKIAGTEAGIAEPQAVFSYCYGAPFLPLHPLRYAKILGEKIRKYKVKCWLVNTGWTGGSYGTGSRIKLSYTRALIQAVFNKRLDKAGYQKDPIFGFAVPYYCNGVPDTILMPRDIWADKKSYDKCARELLYMFKIKYEAFI
ncbi:MAG TPA: phosphoenolpyruvate carboxykinase (ATP) [Ginsengibacter sp.]